MGMVTNPEEIEVIREPLTKELIEDAVSRGRIEIIAWVRIIHQEFSLDGCGHKPFRYGEYSVLYGSVEEIELDHSINQDECMEERFVAIIPRTKEVIVLIRNKDENRKDKLCDKLLVFRYPAGWASINLCDNNIWMS
jgi:hypothetical protein